MVALGFESVWNVVALPSGIEPRSLHRERDKTAIEGGNLPAAQIADAQLKAFEAYSEMTEAARRLLVVVPTGQRRPSTCCSTLKRTSAFCRRRSPAAPAMDNHWRSIFCAQCGCLFERFRSMANTGRRHEAPSPITWKRNRQRLAAHARRLRR